MIKIKHKIILFIILSIISILLFFPFNPFDMEKIIVSLILSFIITILPFSKFPIFSEINISPKSIVYMILYFFVYLWALLKSNLDVAFRVLNPKLPISPGIVKVKTKLKSRLGRIILANSITLTPGTITVETDGEWFYIHWINVNCEESDEATEKIVKAFEKYLEVIFG